MTVSVTVAVGVTVGELELTPGVPVVSVEDAVTPEEAVPLAEAGAVTEPETVTDGVKVGIVGDVVDPLQAETATGARRIRVPQHRAVSLARSAVPVIVARTFMGPPHAPGR